MKSSSSLSFLAPLAACALFAACGSVRTDPPVAQPSSPETPSVIVYTTSGQPFNEPCVIVEAGTTVEWRNLTPLSSISVVSTRVPYELSSPSLLTPYNLVPPEQSDECAKMEGGTCVERRPFSFWRHTFRTPGIFDYKDASGAAAAATTTYSYGMPAGLPKPAGTATGTLCVKSPGGSECVHVCCSGSRVDECASGVACVSGRCGGVTP